MSNRLDLAEKRRGTVRALADIKKQGKLAKASSEFIHLKDGDSQFSIKPADHVELDNDVRGMKDTNTNSVAVAAAGLDKEDDYDRTSYNSATSLTISVGRRPLRNSISSGKRPSTEKADLEQWWLESPIWRRVLPFMVFTIFTVGLAHFAFGIYLLIDGSRTETPDPYICQTESCKSIASFIQRGIYESTEPCENFYEFVCRNYRTEKLKLTTPKVVDLSNARLEFNQRSLIGRILKKNSVTEKKIIPFYKACINTRLRMKNDFDTLIRILNDTLKLAFDNVTNYDNIQFTIRVSRITGQFSLFRIQYGVEPNRDEIFILPPLEYAELRTIDIQNLTDSRTLKFIEGIRNCYEKLWRKFNFAKPEPLTVNEAVNYTIAILQILHKPRPDSQTLPQDSDFKSNSDLLIKGLLDAYLFEDVIEGRATARNKYTIKESPVRDFSYEPRDVYAQVLNVRNIISIEGENVGNPLGVVGARKAFLSLSIYNFLNIFASDVEKTTYDYLSLGVIFPPSLDDQNVPVERFCFESMLRRLGSHVVLTFTEQSEDVYAANVKWLVELFRRTYRGHANLFRNINSNFLYPDQAFVSKAFSFIQAEVLPVYPYKTNEQQNFRLDRLAAVFDDFHPSENHLKNIEIARRTVNQGRINLWKKRSYDPEFTFIKLERMTQQTNNQLYYRSRMYFPITTLDLPYIGNDLKVLDYAGTGLIMAKSLIKLWYYNREEPAAFLQPAEQELFAKLEKVRFLNDKIKNCSILPSQPSRDELDNLTTLPLTNALAFKLAYEIYQNQREYQSFINKSSGLTEESVKFVYNQKNGNDPKPKFYRIEIDEHLSNNFRDASNINLPVQEEDTSKYGLYDSQFPKYQRVYTKLPGLLSKYNMDQLFFITAVRHHCYENDDDEYMMEMNKALSEVKEFGQTFNCKAGSHMSKVDKCF